MRRLLAPSLVVLAAASCTPDADDAHPEVARAVAKTRREHPERFRRKVVVLGFDSCDPDLVEDLVRQGRLPHFARLYREGAYGPLKSLTLLLSPVVWTTIATGMPPERHGILDFVTDTPQGRVPVSSRMRQADTVWELLSREGEEVGVVGWLVTWPAEPVNGFVVTHRMGQLAFEYDLNVEKDAPHRTWPEDLAQDMARNEDLVDAKDVGLAKVRPFADVTQKEYDDAFRASGTAFDPRNPLNNLRLTLATAQTFRNAGERLLRERRPRFFACYFEAMDALSHLFMPYAPPKTPYVDEASYLRYRTAIEENYVWHDRVLGEYMDLADPDTTILVVSDHGFKSGAFRMKDPSDFHAQTGAMWHRQFGVFFAWGNGVKRGARVHGASVYDIAPTILASMGYPVPDDMHGNTIGEAFEGGLDAETVPTYHGEERRDRLAREKAQSEDEPKATSPEDANDMARLAALGYIGGNRSDPASTSLNLGQALLGQGRPRRALEEFRKVLEKARAAPPPASEAEARQQALTKYNTLNLVAEASLRLRSLDEAERCVAESKQLFPDDTWAMLLDARILLDRGRLDEAEAAARAAVALKPDNWQVFSVLATVLEGKFEDAIAKKDAPRAAGERRKLIEAYEDCLRLEPRNQQILADLAQTRLDARLVRDVSRETTEAALRELDAALEMNPGAITAHNNRAIALLRLGILAQIEGRGDEAVRRLEEALAATDKALALTKEQFPDSPGYPKALANKSYVLRQLGRLDEAFETAKSVLALDPSYRLSPDFVQSLASTGRKLPAQEPRK